MSGYYRTLMSNSSQYIPEVQAIIDYAVSQSYSLPLTSTLVEINNLVINLISSGFWNRMDVFYVFGLNDTSLGPFSRINWKDPNNFYTTNVAGTSVTYNVKGWKWASGTGQTLDTNFIPATDGVNFTLNDASFYMKVESLSYNSTGLPSVPSTFNTVYDSISSFGVAKVSVTKVNPAGISTCEFNINGSSITTNFTSTLPAGLNNIMVNRISSNYVNLYHSSPSVNQTYINASTSLSTNSFKMLGTNNIPALMSFGLMDSFSNSEYTTLKGYIDTFHTNIGL